MTVPSSPLGTTTRTRHPWNCPILLAPVHDVSPGVSLQSQEEYGPHRGNTCLHCQGEPMSLLSSYAGLRVQHRVLLCHGCWVMKCSSTIGRCSHGTCCRVGGREVAEMRAHPALCATSVSGRTVLPHKLAPLASSVTRPFYQQTPATSAPYYVMTTKREANAKESTLQSARNCYWQFGVTLRGQEAGRVTITMLPNGNAPASGRPQPLSRWRVVAWRTAWGQQPVAALHRLPSSRVAMVVPAHRPSGKGGIVR